MTYIIAPIFTLILALLGAFYKNTQKKVDGEPVYWHRLPVLTPIGWVLVAALFLSFAISAYSAYEKAARDVKEKEDETKRMLEVALTGKASAPQMNMFVTKEGVPQDYRALRNEIKQVEDMKIGFIPRSVRDVLFPFSENNPRHEDSVIGYIRFRIGLFGGDYQVKASGYIGREPLLFNHIISLETVFTPSSTLADKPNNRFRLVFEFKEPWPWEDLNQSLNNAFIQGKPIIIVHRDHVPIAPGNPPSFTHFGLVMVLSKHPAFNIDLVLEPKNYVYDSQTQSYSYELHISKPPEIITRPLDP